MSRVNDKTTDEMSDRSPIVLFDGVCGLCNRWVDLVMKRDHQARFRFATLQSEAGRRILEQSNLPANETESVVLRDDAGIWTKSSAALRIFKGLGLPYCLAYSLKLIPRPIRDRTYDLIAKHRYRWFGRRTTCRMPTDDERSRFIE